MARTFSDKCAEHLSWNTRGSRIGGDGSIARSPNWYIKGRGHIYNGVWEREWESKLGCLEGCDVNNCPLNSEKFPRYHKYCSQFCLIFIEFISCFAPDLSYYSFIDYFVLWINFLNSSLDMEKVFNVAVISLRQC